jgi:hypothetical protein
MVAQRKYLPGFVAGEIDPLMHGRIETDQYGYGLERCENFVAVNEGPLVKRPGFEYVCEADGVSTWLTAFRFSIEQEYAIEWSEQKARFYTNGGRIETAPGVAYELALPYAAGAAPRLSTQQSYDRLYIDSTGYKPGYIARTGPVTFSYGELVLENGPFADQNTDQAVSVTASGTTGAITLTATAALFRSGHVGSLFQVEAKDFSTIKSWAAGMKDVAAGEIVRSEGKAYTALTGGTTGANAPIHTDGAEWDGQGKKDINDDGPYGVQWQYRHDKFGIARISAAAGNGLSASAQVVRRLPDQLTTVPSWRWRYAAFSADAGWPSHVIHAFGRQLHFKGLDVVASVVNDYGGGRANFATFTSSGTLAADLAFRRTMDADNPPLWVASDNRGVLLGTATVEVAIAPTNSQAALSSDNISAKKQSSYGSEAVPPVQMGTDTVFVERGGRRLRAADYDFGSDRYAPVDLTAAARHVTRGEVVQLALQRLPYAVLYGVRGDGQLIVHAATKLAMKGFSRVVLGGGARALSAVSIVGADGKSDELWLLVERPQGGGSRREIWRQSAWRELGDDGRQAFFVDCGAAFTAAPGQTEFHGFTHLAGQAVAVLANGGVVPSVTVDDAGSFVLPATSVPAFAYSIVVGLPFTAEAITLRPNVDTRAGPSVGLMQRARKVALRLLETMGLRVGGPDGELEEVIDRPTSAKMDAAIPLFTGDTDGAVDVETSADGRVRWVSSDPLPAIINSAMLTLELDERGA